MPPQDVLTAQDLTDIESALVSSKDADELISMARRAGINVDELAKRNKETRERLVQIKRVFFPSSA